MLSIERQGHPVVKRMDYESISARPDQGYSVWAETQASEVHRVTN